MLELAIYFAVVSIYAVLNVLIVVLLSWDYEAWVKDVDSLESDDY